MDAGSAAPRGRAGDGGPRRRGSRAWSTRDTGGGRSFGVNHPLCLVAHILPRSRPARSLLFLYQELSHAYADTEGNSLLLCSRLEMVEAAGIEPASQDASGRASTRVASALISFRTRAQARSAQNQSDCSRPASYGPKRAEPACFGYATHGATGEAPYITSLV